MSRKLYLPLSIILLLNVFFITPFHIYDSNVNEFTASIYSIIKYFSILAVPVFLLLILIGFASRGRYQDIVFACLLSFTFIIWGFGNILIVDYGAWDGRHIQWDKFEIAWWIDILFILLTFVLIVVFRRIIVKPVFVFLLVVSSIQLFYISYKVISDPERYESNFSSRDMRKSLSEYARFSKSGNVIHLVIDGFQSDVFETLINEDKNIKKQLYGFEFYREALSVFPYTRFSVPSFMGAEIYRNDVKKDDFVGRVLEEESILQAAHDGGYDVDIAGEEYFVPFYSRAKHTNKFIISNDPDTIYINNAVTLLELSLFRQSPQFLKKIIKGEKSSPVSDLLNVDSLMRYQYFKHTAFLQYLTKNMSIDRDKPVYKFMHIMNTHTPMLVTEDCLYAGSMLKMVRKTLTYQAACTLDTVIGLFDRMKQLGIYDSSTILIHGDHGGWVKPVRYVSHKIQTPDGEFGFTDEAAGLATPLLAMKLPHQEEELVIKDSLVSLKDIPASMSKALGLEKQYDGNVIQDLSGSDSVVRYFHYYETQPNAWTTDFTGPIYRLKINGSYFDNDWMLEEIYYPPGDER